MLHVVNAHTGIEPGLIFGDIRARSPSEWVCVSQPDESWERCTVVVEGGEMALYTVRCDITVNKWMYIYPPSLPLQLADVNRFIVDSR